MHMYAYVNAVTIRYTAIKDLCHKIDATALMPQTLVHAHVYTSARLSIHVRTHVYTHVDWIVHPHPFKLRLHKSTYMSMSTYMSVLISILPDTYVYTHVDGRWILRSP